jgi:perosamine synthetase
MDAKVTIPVSRPCLTERDVELVAQAVRSGWISSAGNFIEQFETGWAEYCSRRYGIAMCNGTAALHAAVMALELQPGDEVILPTFTIISCAQAIVQAGAKPVLVDIDPRTGGLLAKQVAERIGPRTKAIMSVHIYGHPVDMDPLLALAEQHGLAIIEDAAEVHGAEYLSRPRGSVPVWRRCGTFGTVSTFSFYANKLVTTGEGGMVLTDDDRLAERLRALRNLCFSSKRRFYHDELGFNYRMTNFQAALGVSQMERINATIERKRWVAQEYNRQLGAVRGLRRPIEESWARSVYWVYGIILDEATGLSAADFAEALRRRGVDSRPYFLGMHEQPAFHRLGLFLGERYPTAEYWARQGLYLPSSVDTTLQEIELVCAAVAESLAEAGRV